MSKKHETISGGWISVNSENLPELLAKLGAGFLVKKAAPRATQSQMISFDGMKMRVETNTGFMKKDNVIMLDGSQFSGEMFGKQFVATASFDEDGVITVQSKFPDLDVTSVRKVNEEGQMVLTTTAGDVVCTRNFKRQ